MKSEKEAGEQFQSDFKEFTALVQKRFCPWCGAPVGYQGRGRPRVYCSDRCRWAANKDRERKRRRAVREAVKELLAAHVIEKKYASEDHAGRKEIV